MSFSADRTFWEAELEHGDPPTRRSILIKGSPVGRGGSTPAHVERLSAFLIERDLPVPACYGTVDGGGWRAWLWEYRRGRTEATFAQYGHADLDRLMRAVARIAAASAGAVDRLPLPRGVQWAEPTAERVRELAAGEPVVEALAPQIDTLAAIEHDLIAALSAAGPPVLAHNDLKPSNVVLGEDGEVSIVDWDSASVGPPGVTLRTFAEQGGELERTAASLYAGHLAALGVPVTLEELLLVMRGQQLLWGLVSGLRRKHLRRILASLWLVDDVAEDLRALPSG